jgi:small-conductance mechanosensitive channel
MDTLTQTTLFGITALDWLRGFGIGAAVTLSLWALRQGLVRRLRNAGTTETWVDDLFLLLAQRTSRVYMLALGVAAMAVYEVGEQRLPTWLRVLILATICIQVMRWANTAVDFWIGRMNRSSDGEANSAGSLAVIGILIRTAIFLLVLVVALDNAGVNVTALVTGLGITGIAVALAVQNILGDLLAALAIAFDKPFAVGDEITVADVSGKVEKVGLKTTRLRLATGEEVSIANAEVMKSRLTNVSRVERRVLVLTVGVPAVGQTGESLLALASRCETAASGVEQVTHAKARLQSIVDGRARITVECTLVAPGVVLSVRPKLIAALTDVTAADGRPVLGIG